MTYPQEATFDKFVPNASVAWKWMLTDVMNNGLSVTVRGRNITEIMHRTAIIDMNQPVVAIEQRKLGYAFMLAEAAWILSGNNDVKSIKPFSKIIHQFSDDGIFFRGAYGPQIIQQLPYIIESFKTDKYTRQAVISIWKPSPMPSKDIPCTVAVQFMIRGGLLHAYVDMRSSDCWLGVPYDWFNFSMLTKYLLLILKEDENFSNVELGFLHFKANSQHIYEDNNPRVADVLKESYVCEEGKYIQDMVKNFNEPHEFISNLWKTAYAILSGAQFGLEY